MSSLEPSPTPQPITPEACKDLVERISASHGFHRSARLRDFLAYICDRVTAGREDEINEQHIGHRVFGRHEDYEPASDNIVRVQARELRKRLAAYFAGEGSNEPVVIQVPKGGYVPVFKPRADAARAPGNGDDGSHESGGKTSAFTYVLTAVSVVLLLASGWLYSEVRELKNAGSRGSEPTRAGQFWQRFFSGTRPALIILADSNFALLQDLRREAVSFQDYASGRYFGSLAPGESSTSELDRTYRMIASRHYTSLADVNTVVRLLGMNVHRSPVAIRSVRGLDIRDLKPQNSIILGSERSTPLAGIFNEARRFLFEYDPGSGRPSIRDTRPAEGQPSVYAAGQEGGEAYDAYGVVASIPNLGQSGHVILIYGTNMQGTEAAGEFVSNTDSFGPWLERIGWTADRELPTFEVLLKLTTVGDSSYSSEIVAADYPGGAVRRQGL